MSSITSSFPYPSSPNGCTKQTTEPTNQPTSEQASKQTNKQIPRSTALLEKLGVQQQVKKFSAVYGTQMFITVFTKACHLSPL
jgi:hypothetical protein